MPIRTNFFYLRVYWVLNVDFILKIYTVETCSNKFGDFVRKLKLLDENLTWSGLYRNNFFYFQEEPTITTTKSAPSVVKCSISLYFFFVTNYSRFRNSTFKRETVIEQIRKHLKLNISNQFICFSLLSFVLILR